MFPDVVTRVLIPSALAAIGIVALAPRALPSLAGAARPVVKTCIKLGLAVGDKTSEAVSAIQQQWTELSTEARNELAAAGSEAGHSQRKAVKARAKETIIGETVAVLTGLLLYRR